MTVNAALIAVDFLAVTLRAVEDYMVHVTGAGRVFLVDCPVDTEVVAILCSWVVVEVVWQAAYAVVEGIEVAVAVVTPGPDAFTRT